MSTSTVLEIPGRKSPYILDVVFEMRKKGFLGFFHDVWKQYGDLARIQIGKQSMYLAVHPDHVRHILLTNRKNYEKLGSYDVVRKYLLGNGLFTSRDKLWQRQRRLMAPFFTPRYLGNYYPVFIKDGQALIDRWENLAGTGKEVEMSEEMMRVTAAIILRSMFGSGYEQELVGIKEAIETMIAFTARREMHPFQAPMWMPTPKIQRYKAARNKVNTFIKRLIETRRQLPEDQWPDDLLSKLMFARDEETGEAMSESLLRDESVTMFVAGHETTARTLSFMWYALDQNPKVAARLHAELDTVLGGSLPTVEDLYNLPYLLQVLKETLRLYPAAPVYVRDAVGDDMIGGIPIPAGSRVMLSPFLTHRHPAFWPDPERFDPDRWSPECEAEMHPTAWHPFAAGQRICIGNNFSLMESHILAAMLAQKFAPRARPGHKLELDMVGTLTSQNGTPMYIERRDNVKRAAQWDS